jgi:hypothetical protein
MKITSKGLVNAVQAAARVARVAAVEDPRVEKTLQKKRLCICQDCGYMQGYQCSRCECFIRLKTMLKTEKCPEGKW